MIMESHQHGSLQQNLNNYDTKGYANKERRNLASLPHFLSILLFEKRSLTEPAASSQIMLQADWLTTLL